MPDSINPNPDVQKIFTDNPTLKTIIDGVDPHLVNNLHHRANNPAINGEVMAWLRSACDQILNSPASEAAKIIQGPKGFDLKDEVAVTVLGEETFAASGAAKAYAPEDDDDFWNY